MADANEGTNDAITEDEINGVAPPPPSSSQPRNAFTALMAPKPSPSKPTTRSLLTRFTGRWGLGAYIASPASFPSPPIIFTTPTSIAIVDLYPKSSIHTLLLPRSPAHTKLHPYDAFDDTAFLASVRADALRLSRHVASELRRRHGPVSAQDRLREAALSAHNPPDTPLPAGRDWAAAVRVGIHAHPSMAHLHVHVLSVDRVSDCLRHRKHYTSFATPFFVPLEDFPLTGDDERRRHARDREWLNAELRCWRCQRSFGTKGFAALKTHLEEEFEQWMRE